MFAANHTSNNNTLPTVDDFEPKFAPMTAADLNNNNNIIKQNLTSSSSSSSPSNYQLTFYVDNETNNNHLQLTDFTHFHSNNNHNNVQEAIVMNNDDEHQTYCMLSAFLYFVTITSFVYLAVLWIKQRMHVHVEQMQWW